MKNDAKNNKPLSRLKILFADDESSLQEVMSLELPRMGHEVTVCPDGQTALAALERNSYDCLLVDLDMPGLNGIQVIERARDLCPEAVAVVLTGKSTLESAIAALRHGVFDYLTKPCSLKQIEALLGRVADRRQFVKTIAALQRRVLRLEGTPHLIGRSRAMADVKGMVSRVAPTNSTVLILGETGSGKELVARAVHDQSTRADKPFVAINCGALPETLIESELFGHRKGAFTGADDHRVGLFEVANGGTLFLDEIGELPKAMQAKLLRVLESREIRRVGDNDTTKIDVRIVCATHRNLEKMVEADEFREDLLYRINTFEIAVLPLRERIEDIPELADHLFQRFRRSAHGTGEIFAPQTLEALMAHSWPGNVRELSNVIEHAAIVCDQLPIRPEHLPRRFGSRGAKLPHLGPISLRDLEMVAINEALERHEGNKSAAAEELGIGLKTLYNKLNQTTSLEKTG